eukprot:TRINITY_DN38195_c0_g1_i1.p1 TRINITY_DN38195_c0_g1~~TRINITY_DN38195_c0_g1_i1.p1  ORF type:complete len:194 (+),score=11.82 TRINITY_DN38195_c0_g1_i1:120-701(+)
MGSCMQANTCGCAQEPRLLDGVGGRTLSRGGTVSTVPDRTNQLVTFAALRHLQYRELTPEDFDLLCQLDERTPQKGHCSASVLCKLQRVPSCEVGATSCAVCLTNFGPDVSITRLPCRHAFCSVCIESWLASYKGDCPICRIRVEDSFPDGSTSTRETSVDGTGIFSQASLGVTETSTEATTSAGEDESITHV